MHAFYRSTFLVSKFNNSPYFILKNFKNNLINNSKFTTFSINDSDEIFKHNKFNEDEEPQSILLDPKGPYAPSPRYKRAPAPKAIDFKYLTKLEQNVYVNPYVSMIGSPIRQCIYHQRWFPRDFLVRFIRAYDKETSSVWIVPDVMEEGATKRPGIGYWVKSNARILQNFLKEGKYKAIDNKAYWRKDMHEHIWKILVEDSILRFDRIIEKLESIKFPMERKEAFLPIIKVDDPFNHYYVNCSKPIRGLQCVLILDEPSDKMIVEESDDENKYPDNKKSKKSKDSYIPLKIPSDHIGSIEKVSYYSSNNVIGDYVTQNIPFYYVKTIWGDQGIEKIKKYLHLEENQNPMIGIICMPQTKQLALSLWKLRNYWQ